MAALQTRLPAAVAVAVAPTTTVNEGLAGVGVGVVVEHREGGAAGPSVRGQHAVLCRHTGEPR